MSLINEDKYYIVDLRDSHKPSLFYNEYKTENRAIDTIIRILKYNFIDYTTIKGEDAIFHKLELKTKGKRFLPDYKYDYPDERDTKQKRKTYRTIIRRKLRILLKQYLKSN
jgi:hypothetical protein